MSYIIYIYPACETSSRSLTSISILPLTVRQIESLLWEEIRRRFASVSARAASDPSLPKLEGSLLQTRLRIAEGHFAMGLSTDEPVRFQGFHAENLLVVLDEACGVPEDIWEAVEGVCVGRNNRALAISNPLTPGGRFYALFKSPRWATYTISALAHPNVQARKKRGAKLAHIPGAVTREAVADRIADWCEEETEALAGAENSAPGDLESVIWEGKRYRPNGMFRARVLGEFPHAGDDSLIALSWIEAAQARHKAEQPPSGDDGLCVLAVDVARFGSDETVFAVRRGNVVTRLLTQRGLDTMTVAGRVVALAREERAEIVTVDEVGVGAGVVDRLEELQVAGLVPVHFGARPIVARDAEQYLNLRAQTYWMLRERFRQSQIAIPADPMLAAQLAGLRYFYTSGGQIQIESKDEMRKRGMPSPDRADALALLFGPFAGTSPLLARLPQPSMSRHDTAEPIEPIHWDQIQSW